MAVAFRSASIGTDLSTALPSGHTQDDIILALVTTETNGTTPGTATGWTPIGSDDSCPEPGRPLSGHFFWIRRGASAPATNWTSGGGSTPQVGYVCYSGCKTSGDPINASLVTGQPTGNGDTTYEHGPITTTVDNCMIVGLSGCNNWTTSSSTDFANERADGGATISQHFYDDDLLTTAGSTGTLVVTGGTGWVNCLIALEPETSVAELGPAPPVFGPGSFGGPDSFQWLPPVWLDEADTSEDHSTSGLLVVGTWLDADTYSKDTNIAASPLYVAATPYATVSKDSSIASAPLYVGTHLRAPVTKDVTYTEAALYVAPVPYAQVLKEMSYTGVLYVGAVPYAPVTHDATVAAILPVSAVPYGTYRKDATVVGHMPVGSGLWAPYSKDSTVTGLLPVAAGLWAPVTRTANVVGYLPVGTVLYGIVSGSNDISTTGLLVVGAFPRALVSKDSSATGSLWVGTDVRAPVTRTANVTGTLYVASSIGAPAAKTVNTVGVLYLGGQIYLVSVGVPPEPPRRPFGDAYVFRQLQARLPGNRRRRV